MRDKLASTELAYLKIKAHNSQHLKERSKPCGTEVLATFKGRVATAWLLASNMIQGEVKTAAVVATFKGRMDQHG
jgi:hypothetical protein